MADFSSERVVIEPPLPQDIFDIQVALAELTDVVDDNTIAIADNTKAIGDNTTSIGNNEVATSTNTTNLQNHESSTKNVHGIEDTSTLVITTDPRLSDARTPTAHAATHEIGGTDEITIAQSQVTNLVTDLASKISGDGSITQLVALTQAQYDAITPVPTTLYVVTD